MPLTETQIRNLVKDEHVQNVIEVNKAQVQAKRESDLMLLGYNEALLDKHVWPEGHTSATWRDVVEMQKRKLGIE